MNHVKYQGREYAEIIEFNCTFVKLKTLGGGTFVTCIPVSPLEYRIEKEKKYPWPHKYCPKANVVIERDVIYTTFKIMDDYGEVFIMEIPNEMEHEINFAAGMAIRKGLIK